MTAEYRASLGHDENIRKLTVATVAQLCEYTNHHCVVYFKGMNCMTCELHLHNENKYYRKFFRLKEKMTWDSNLTSNKQTKKNTGKCTYIGNYISEYNCIFFLLIDLNSNYIKHYCNL